MGYDYSNLQVFVGDKNPESLKKQIIACICNNLNKQVATEEDASRSIVVGICDRWIFVGDSAGSNEGADSEAFK